ncbi:MAG: GAK system XXXCH domain-containing protein [Solidesulfovibrio sp.]|jgi:XXXCH domain-containing protein|uniref:GAK system XXXCH domain-containing protein n=1 Tax=Solidesulfovibrio sp. TaxID=2910990 RepID=UPI002B1E9F69|nr:GAK system XXXCH domain-containing protein [Solidesulfovibrio sp.]MEA4858106.1 GAK system XXXCH domain-containing protein [Solidesulfovibrio sp.]
MSASRKRKFEMVLPRVEALRALTELTARAAEGALVVGGEAVALKDFTSLKIGIKDLGASCLLKVSLKYPALGVAALPSPASVDAEEGRREHVADHAPEPMDEGDKPRYKGLKKRMKHFFKAIVTSLRAGTAPDADVLAAFVADSRLMTGYPGRGDAFYPAYDAEVDRLEAAAAAGDLDAMTASVAALDRMKKECHSRHA